MLGVVWLYLCPYKRPIEMVGPVPKTVQDGKQDTLCGIVFDLVCESKFGNFAESWLIEIIGPSMSCTVFCHLCTKMVSRWLCVVEIK